MTRKAKATRVPAVRPPSGPMAIPTSSTAAVVRTEQLAGGEEEGADGAGPDLSAWRRPSTVRITRRWAWAWTP